MGRSIRSSNSRTSRMRLFTDEDNSPIPMMSLTPGKLDDIDEIRRIITPCKGGNPFVTASEDEPSSNSEETSFHLTPLGSWTENHSTTDANSSCEQLRLRRPKRTLGRFHSFDTKRSLFSSKRAATDDIDDISPAMKRTCDHGLITSGGFSIDNCPASESQLSVISAVDRLTSEEDLIADGTTPYCLPTILGKHADLKYITPSTLANVLRGDYSKEIDKVTIIDCRYPYEYQGGHIQGAVNLYTREAINAYLHQMLPLIGKKRHVLVFHCEFSSQRGPKLLRFLRSQDRELNKSNYPQLKYPEIYLLEGGYKAFYETQQNLCEPRGYTPMLHKDYTSDLRHFRVRSKSWTAGEKINQTRHCLRF